MLHVSSAKDFPWTIIPSCPPDIRHSEKVQTLFFLIGLLCRDNQKGEVPTSNALLRTRKCRNGECTEIIREERSSAVELTYVVRRTFNIRQSTTFVGLSCAVAPPETMPSIITLTPFSLSFPLSSLAWLVLIFYLVPFFSLKWAARSFWLRCRLWLFFSPAFLSTLLFWEIVLSIPSPCSGPYYSSRVMSLRRVRTRT